MNITLKPIFMKSFMVISELPNDFLQRFLKESSRWIARVLSSIRRCVSFDLPFRIVSHYFFGRENLIAPRTLTLVRAFRVAFQRHLMGASSFLWNKTINSQRLLVAKSSSRASLNSFYRLFFTLRYLQKSTLFHIKRKPILHEIGFQESNFVPCS